MGKPKVSVKNLIWFPLQTEDAARLARMPALVFAALGAAIWSIIAIVRLFTPSTYGSWAIFYAILSILISWGLFRMRREAAIAGFILSLVSLFFDSGSIQAISQALVGLIVYHCAIRGTFAYLHLSKHSKNTLDF
jgi:hypothetical protein